MDKVNINRLSDFNAQLRVKGFNVYAIESEEYVIRSYWYVLSQLIAVCNYDFPSSIKPSLRGTKHGAVCSGDVIIPQSTAPQHNIELQHQRSGDCHAKLRKARNDV